MDRLGPAVGAALAATSLFVASLALPLQAAADLGLSSARLTSWLFASYGLVGLSAVVLSLRYRQPLLLTGNIFVFILIARVAAQGSATWPAIVAATMLAGVLLLALGGLGLVDRIRQVIPAPVVFGLLAGAVMPFFSDLFSSATDSPGIVLPAVVTWLVSHRFLGPRLPAIIPALAVSCVAALMTGDLSLAGARVGIPTPVIIGPALHAGTLLSLTPVILVLMTVQANIPATVFLREQGYDPPERTITNVSGAATAVVSALGPSAFSLSLLTTALTAGPDAGPKASRRLAAALGGVGEAALGLGAVTVVALAPTIPDALLDTAVGLSVIGILRTALERIATGPLTISPLFAFGIALSDLTLLGLGAFFWAIAGGIAVAAIVEPAGFRASRTPSRKS